MIRKEIALYVDWCELERCSNYLTPRKAGAISLILRRLLLENLVHDNNRLYRFKIKYPLQPLTKSIFSQRASFQGAPEFHHGGTLEYPNLVSPYHLDQFLAHKLLYLDGQYFSIKELIDFVANKLGGVHFDKSLVLGNLPFDPYDPEVAKALCAAIVIIARATCFAIRPLAQKCSPLPSYHQCIGHYQVGRGVADFDEHHWMEINLSNVGTISEFGWSAVLEPKPIRSGQEIIYSLVGCTGELIEIELNYKGDLSLNLQNQASKQIISLRDDGRVRPIGKTIYMQVALFAGKQQAAKIELHGRRCSFKLKEPFGPFAPKRVVLGADQSGNHGAGFRLNELFVMLTADTELLRQLRDYYVARYKFDD